MRAHISEKGLAMCCVRLQETTYPVVVPNDVMKLKVPLTLRHHASPTVPMQHICRMLHKHTPCAATRESVAHAIKQDTGWWLHCWFRYLLSSIFNHCFGAYSFSAIQIHSKTAHSSHIHLPSAVSLGCIEGFHLETDLHHLALGQALGDVHMTKKLPDDTFFIRMISPSLATQGDLCPAMLLLFIYDKQLK